MNGSNHPRRDRLWSSHEALGENDSHWNRLLNKIP